MSDPFPTVVRSARVLRWGLGLALGVLAGLVDQVQVPMFTEETPLFILGGTFVLIAYVVAGTGPGLLASLVTFTSTFAVPQAGVHAALVAGGFLYVVEAFAASFLFRRVHSLPLAVAIFWLLGWPLSFVVYNGWGNLPTDYVLLLVTKQLLNGLLNASLAEILLFVVVPWLLPESWRARGEDVKIREYAFRRLVVLVLLPAIVLVVLAARAQFRQEVEEVHGENRSIATATADAVREFLARQEEVMQAVIRSAQASPELRHQEILDQFRGDRPELYVAALADAGGRVTASSPSRTVEGVTVAGYSVADRDYFRQVRDTRSTSYSDLLVGQLHLRSAETEPAMILAEPILDATGGFRGALLLSFDPRALVQSSGLIESARSEQRNVTLVDRRGRLLLTDKERFATLLGQPARELLRRQDDTPFDPPGDGRAAVFSYYPPRDDSLASRAGLMLIHAASQPIPPTGWSVLVGTSAASIWGRLQPITLQVASAAVALLLIVWATALSLARSITNPIRGAARLAGRIERGDLGDTTDLEPLRAAGLQEVSSLAHSLERMETALDEAQRASRSREQVLEQQLIQSQKLEAIGLLAGGVAHDFNNSLAPILGYADLGESTIDDPEAKEYFREIGEAAEGARHLVRQLLAFGRRQILEVKEHDIAGLVQESEKLLRHLLRSNVRLHIDAPEPGPLVQLDAAQFQQILMNLAINAQDAMPEGGDLTLTVELAASAPRSEPQPLPPHESWALLRVRDDGSGIDPETLPSVFDPFFTTKTGSGGSGLGLSTVHGIVQQHHGAIEVESELGVGTEFQIYLPARAPASHPSEEASRPAASRLSRPPRILLVEDDPSVGRMIRRGLIKRGFEVTVFGSAEEAIAALDGSDDLAFEALVSDYMLPGMSGTELHQALADRGLPCPALLISGYGHEALGAGALPAGVRFLNKPFVIGEAVAQLHELLGTPQEPGGEP